MLLIRPIHTDDLDQLHHLTMLSSFGLTNLPKDRELLAKHIWHELLTFLIVQVSE